MGPGAAVLCCAVMAAAVSSHLLFDQGLVGCLYINGRGRADVLAWTSWQAGLAALAPLAVWW